MHRHDFILGALQEGPVLTETELWQRYKLQASAHAENKTAFLDTLSALAAQGIITSTGPQEWGRVVPRGVEDFNTAAIHIDCLVNRARCLREPEDKNGFPYGHRHYTIETLPLATLGQQTLLAGYQLVPGRFEWTALNDTSRVLRHSEAWQSQQAFLVEWDDVQEETLKTFLAHRPFVQDNAYLITESISSRRNGNGLRVRAVFCLPRPIHTRAERRYVTDALFAELPYCDKGALENICAGGHGRKDAPHCPIGNIVATGWLNAALAAGRAEEERKAQEQASKPAHQQAWQPRAADGISPPRTRGDKCLRAGELPVHVLSQTAPDAYLRTIGLAPTGRETASGGHWGRPDKRGDVALTVKTDGTGVGISVYAQSLDVPPGTYAWPRFYCLQKFGVDIKGMSPQEGVWKTLQAELAAQGFGEWISDEAFRARREQAHFRGNGFHDEPEPIAQLPADCLQSPLWGDFKQSEEARGPSWRHFTREQRLLMRHVLAENPGAGWHRRNGKWIPHFTTNFQHLHPLTGEFARNGQPPEVEKRRVWVTQFVACDVCGGTAAKWIDRLALTAGVYCEGCHTDSPLGSYAHYEWERKPTNAILSQFPGYLAKDPAIQDLPIWQPGTLALLASGMNTGKTYFIFSHVQQHRLTHPDALFIYLGARISQVKGVYAAQHKHTPDAWGLFCMGVAQQHKCIKKLGAISTITSLPQVLKAIQADAALQERPLFLIIDEVDFAFGLLNASIVKTLARHTKAILRRAIAENGIVVAGQTENTLALEGLAMELGVAPENIHAYYKPGNLGGARCYLHELPDVTGKKNVMVAAAAQKIRAVLASGKKAYVFCQGRRTAQVLAQEHPESLLYDRYHRGDVANAAVLYRQQSNVPLFVASKAVDVGISIRDKHAVVIVVADENPRRIGGIASTAQQCVRNREGVETHVFYTHWKNAEAAVPSELTQFACVAETEKALALATEVPETLIVHRSHRRGLEELSDQEPTAFLHYHLAYAGFDVIVAPMAPLPSESTVMDIATRRKTLCADETTAVTARALEILQTHEMLAEGEIYRLGTAGKLTPMPTEQLAMELALAACHAVGFKPRPRHAMADDAASEKGDDHFLAVDDDVLSDAQFLLAQDFVNAQIHPDAFAMWRNGFVGVHYNEITHAELQEEPADIELPHRYDGRPAAALLTACLAELPLDGTVVSVDNFGHAIVKALSHRHGNKRLSQLLKNGACGENAAISVRFSRTGEPSLPLTHWARAWLPANYPLKIATWCDADKHLTHLQVRKHPQWELIVQCIQCQLHATRDDVPPRENAALMPQATERADRLAEAKQRARALKREGATRKAIRQQTGLSERTISKVTADIKKPPAASSVKARILTLLADGRTLRRADINTAINATKQAITKALKQLCQNGELQKPQHGYYQRTTCKCNH